MGAIDKMALPAIGWALSTLGVNPIWGGMLMASGALFGYYLQIKQDELNDFVQFIMDHPEEFSEIIVRQPAFQQGFFLALEAYLKARDVEKKKAIKMIFLGFATCEDKKRFQLERLLDVVARLSPDAIEYLRFISTVILPPLREYARSEGQRLQAPASEGGQSAEWWEKLILTKNEPITKHIKKWIYDEYDPNSKKVLEQYGTDGTSREINATIYAAKEPHDKRLIEMTAEFLSLGIFHTIPGVSLMGGSTPDEQTFTAFGWEIFEYIEDVSMT